MVLNLKYLKYILLTLTVSMATLSSVQARECKSFLTKFDTKAYDPVEILKKAGLNPDNVLLEFTYTPGGDEAPSWELVIKYKSPGQDYHHEIGGMSAWAIRTSFDDDFGLFTGWQDYKIWRTDTSVMSIQGVGLGQLMYLLMATKFYEAHPSKHLITTDHSGSANDMWEALKRKGFATKFSTDDEGNIIPPSEERGIMHEINKKLLGKKIKDFVKQFKVKRSQNNY